MDRRSILGNIAKSGFLFRTIAVIKKLSQHMLIAFLLVVCSAMWSVISGGSVIVSASSHTTQYVKHPTITNSNYYFRLYPAVDHLSYGEMTDASRYARIIDQFNVTYGEHDQNIDGWYESVPGSSYRKYTYCNYFAVDVSFAMGAYLPLVHNCTICGRPTEQSFVSVGVSSWDHYMYQVLQNGSLLCLNPDHSSSHKDYNANMIADWLANPSFSNLFGWFSVDKSEAQASANKGYLTIGIKKESGAIGHVFVVHPHSNLASNIFISQAGADLMSDEIKPNHYINYQYYTYQYRNEWAGQTPISSGGHDSRLEGNWQQSLFGFVTMTLTFRRDGSMTISTLGYSLDGTYSTSGDRYTMDYVVPGYGSYSSSMQSALQGSGLDPGNSGSGTFILSGDTLYLDGLQFARIR